MYENHETNVCLNISYTPLLLSQSSICSLFRLRLRVTRALCFPRQIWFLSLNMPITTPSMILTSYIYQCVCTFQTKRKFVQQLEPRKDSIFTYLNVYQGAGPPSMKYTKSSYQQPIGQIWAGKNPAKTVFLPTWTFIRRPVPPLWNTQKAHMNSQL